MGVGKYTKGIAQCDLCKREEERSADIDATLVECLPAGWVMLEVKMHRRTAYGYTSEPTERVVGCCPVCAGLALSDRVKEKYGDD